MQRRVKSIRVERKTNKQTNAVQTFVKYSNYLIEKKQYCCFSCQKTREGVGNRETEREINRGREYARTRERQRIGNLKREKIKRGRERREEREKE